MRIAHCLFTVSQHQAAAGHGIQVEDSQPRLIGNWDAGRLERVLANVLGNAIKYSAAGRAIRVRVDQEDGMAVLAVQDQGIGIPAADLPHVFERFHRAGNVSGRTPGTGLGLASARQIVEQHGGMIMVESQEGAGSTVTIRLPLGEACRRPEPAG